MANMNSVIGTESKFNVWVPGNLEPRAVVVAGENNAGDGSNKPVLRDWRLVDSGSNRELQIQLQVPVSGEITVTLHFVPKSPFGSGVVALQLPQPLGAKCTGGVVGYRTYGFETSDKVRGLATRSFHCGSLLRRQ